MRKYTLRELRDYARTGAAENLNNATLEAIKAMPPLERVGYSCGTYGINGGLLCDPETRKLFVITVRSTILFYLF